MRSVLAAGSSQRHSSRRMAEFAEANRPACRRSRAGEGRQVGAADSPADERDHDRKECGRGIATLDRANHDGAARRSRPQTAARACGCETDASLGEEGYRIAVEGDDLVLAGGTGRGVVNAVYALLEEDLGCRFYTNDSIKLPQGNYVVGATGGAVVSCRNCGCAIRSTKWRSIPPGRFAIARTRLMPR